MYDRAIYLGVKLVYSQSNYFMFFFSNIFFFLEVIHKQKSRKFENICIIDFAILNVKVLYYP